MGGKKKLRKLRKLAEDAKYDKGLIDLTQDDAGEDRHRMSAKQMSKKNARAKSKKKSHVELQHRWYLVRIADTKPPTQDFLQESFASLVDDSFKMLGLHYSTTSARFYIEDNKQAVEAIKNLHRRITGMEGRLLNISVEPCRSFLLLNAQQVVLAKQVLEKRFNIETGIVDLTNFHYDPLFQENNLLPVLWDPAIFKQILTIIRDNVPNLRGIVLNKNGLRLTSIRVLAGTLGKCPLNGINLEHNDIENVKEMINVLSVFPVLELKLVGNPCLKDIRNPLTYIKTIQAKLTSLKYLDGIDIVEYLTKNCNDRMENSCTMHQSVASTSSVTSTSSAPAPSTEVTEMMMSQYTREFYDCIDSPQRLQLVDAFTTTAQIMIQSQVEEIPTFSASGQNDIRTFLTCFPPTNHCKESFSCKLLSVEPASGAMEVSGKFQIVGVNKIIDFVHRFKIVPFNAGLGCVYCEFSFKGFTPPT